MRALLLLAAASAALSGSWLPAEGGEVRSPDARFRIIATPVAGSDPPAATASLTGADGASRPLMRFQRGAEVVWLADKVLLLERAISFSQLRAFPLQDGPVPADRLQSDILRGMAHRMPRLGQVQDRQYHLGEVAGAFCVSVEESGQSPGRGPSRLITRRGAFRLDLHAMHALPVNGCAGR
jgi:hypothetical protein